MRTCTSANQGEPWVEEITYDTPFGDGYMLGIFMQRVVRLGKGLMVFLTDVTDERRMESELRGFADVVAHDLREPLANMAILITLLERREEEPPEPDVLRLLRDANERARQLIDAVLVYARVGELQVELVALDRLLETVAADLRPGLGGVGRHARGGGAARGRRRPRAAAPRVSEPGRQRAQVQRRGTRPG